jgi:hypothetical protein
MRVILFSLLISVSLFAQSNFNKYFLDKTLQINLTEAGDSETENIYLSSMLETSYYSGSRTNLLDTLNLGYYYAYLYSIKNSQLIFSEGFSTLFQEWQTTEEAKKNKRSLSFSLRIPFPKDSVKLVIKKRDKSNEFETLFSLIIDPANYFIHKEKIDTTGVFKINYSGNYKKKLDILFLPEGYSKNDSIKYHQDCERFATFLLGYSPFSEMRNKINIWGINRFSRDSGVDIPGKGIYKNTLLDGSFYTFDSERYLMIKDYFKLADIAAAVPYDRIFILVNSSKYGGGAIYNFYSTVASGNPKAELVLVHEFGHGLAGLADEYYTSDVSYENYYDLSVEPWEKNITTLVNFDKKWKSMLKPGTPVPTPPDSIYRNQTGVYEGGGYVAKGVYRPSFNSIMKSLSAKGFNEVCKKAIIDVINFYSE